MSDEQRPELTFLQRDIREGIENRGDRRTCCVSYAYERGHTNACTSNEAVLSRIDPNATTRKAAEIAEHRRLWGDPLDRMPLGAQTRVQQISSLPWDTSSSGRLGFRPTYDRPTSDIEPGTNMAIRHSSFSLCELCGLRQAVRPKERETVVTLRVTPFWRLTDGFSVAVYRLTHSRQGVRPLYGATGRLEAVQVAMWGPFLLLVQGPSWDDASRTIRWERSWRLGRFFRVRPWLCLTCQVSGDVALKRARGEQRRRWFRVLGRELRVFGNWLSR